MVAEKTIPIDWRLLLTTAVKFLHDDIWRYPKLIKLSFFYRLPFFRPLHSKEVIPQIRNPKICTTVGNIINQFNLYSTPKPSK